MSKLNQCNLPVEKLLVQPLEVFIHAGGPLHSLKWYALIADSPIAHNSIVENPNRIAAQPIRYRPSLTLDEHLIRITGTRFEANESNLSAPKASLPGGWLGLSEMGFPPTL
jgi:hypothetical protein